MRSAAILGLGVLGGAVYGTGLEGLEIPTDKAPVVYEYDVMPAGKHWAATVINVATPTDRTTYVKLRLLNTTLQVVDAPYLHYEQSSEDWQVRAFIDTAATPDKLVFEISTNNPGSINIVKSKYNDWRVQINMVAI